MPKDVLHPRLLLAMSVASLLLYPHGAAAQTEAGAPPEAAGEAQKPPPEQDATELAKATQNPIGDLISVPFQFNFNTGGGLEDLACLRCGGRRRVLAYVKGAGGVRAILEHLGLPRRVRTWPLREGRPRARSVEAQAATASQESQAPAAPLLGRRLG